MSKLRAFLGRAEQDRGARVSVCLQCGTYCALGSSYCQRHTPVPRARKLRGGGATISRFRRDVLLRAGSRCEAVVDGVRCEVTGADALEAHHVRPITAGGTNDASTNGVALCRAHHSMLTARGL
jgi:hypothetical protein